MGKTIFTIARQYGSSGRMVGRKLADQLKIHYYDRELLRLASNESGIDEELFYKADEKLKKTFFDYLARHCRKRVLCDYWPLRRLYPAGER